jgi:hypothetical protein
MYEPSLLKVLRLRRKPLQRILGDDLVKHHGFTTIFYLKNSIQGRFFFASIGV